jgi:hypothetical protein
VREDRAGLALLVVGWAAFFLGIAVMILTVRFKPEELASRFHWLPAPDYHRFIGMVALFAGLILVSAGLALRRHR